MNFQLIDIIDKVSSRFFVVNNNVYYPKDKTYFPNTILLRNGEEFFNKFTSNNLHNGVIFLSNTDHEVYTFKDGEAPQLLTDKGEVFSIKWNNRYAMFYERVPEPKNYLFDLEEQKIVKEVRDIYYLLNTDECLNVDTTTGPQYYDITKENLNTGEIMWTFDLRVLEKVQLWGEETFDYVQSVIGHTEKEIWLSTAANRLLVLDINLGTLVHVFDWHDNEEIGQPCRKANIIEDKVIVFFRNLTIIDIKTKSIVTHKTPEEISDVFKIIEVDDVSKPQGDYITFYGSVKGNQIIRTVVGVFNYKTIKLEWYKIFGDKEKFSSATLPPVLAGNKLYSLSFRNRLHVFEDMGNTSG